MKEEPQASCSSSRFTGCQAPNSIFAQLKPSDVESLVANGEPRMYEHGDLVYTMHELSTGLYCLVEGKVEVFRIGGTGKVQVLRLAGTGDIVGYRSLLTGEPHQSSARAIEHSQACYIPKDSFLSLLSRNGDLAVRLMALLSTDLRHAEELIYELAYRPVKERVAEVLLTLRDTYGYRDDHGTLDISMTRRELASIAGVAMETMSRQLQRFRREGILELSHQKIRIVDDHALLRAARAGR